MLPPRIVPLPDVGRTRPSSIRIVVVLPAPFGPTKPQTDPEGMASARPSTTVRSPKRFVSPAVETARCPRGPSSVRYIACCVVIPEQYGPRFPCHAARGENRPQVGGSAADFIPRSKAGACARAARGRCGLAAAQEERLSL